MNLDTANLLATLAASIIGGGVSGVAIVSKIKTDVDWLKRTIDRLERQHDAMTSALTALRLSAAIKAEHESNKIIP